MKFYPRWAITALLLAALGASSAANAALLSRLGGAAVYDTDFNITWLANANANGLMTWSQANAWAAGLTVVGVSGWRLPTSLQPDATCSIQNSNGSNGYNCTGSEMGHLFFNELGGVAGVPIATTHNANYNLFTNIQDAQASTYWSGTSESAPNTNYAWNYSFASGYQGTDVKDNGLYAWAVRSGDVAAVPIPAAAWLFGSGLVGLIGFARRKKTSA